ncbi:MAG: SIR2 family NAD-dependent protein deacylase [Nannocystaceae bacterium]
MLDLTSVRAAAEAIRSASGLLIGAGAGMGVDSGLPDFRGTEGFWRAYPPYARLGVHFEEMADPIHFQRDPSFAWGFYGHRRNLYRATVPHRGFEILRGFAEPMKAGVFVFTSNVDGQFQRAGFLDDRIVECHGAIEYEQCMESCGAGIWRATEGATVDVDEETMRAVEPLPRCAECDAVARPNILMFGDWSWDAARTQAQMQQFASWSRSVVPSEVTVIELGAGTAIPTVRGVSDRWEAAGATLIRVNPRESEVYREGSIALRAPAGEALQRVLDVYIELAG